MEAGASSVKARGLTLQDGDARQPLLCIAFEAPSPSLARTAPVMG
jgi:hypothetical protein